MADVFAGLCKNTTGYDINSICNSCVQDVAARGVGTELNLASTDCSMHQGDKPGRSAIGLLVRSRKKTVINPFDKGFALYEKAHKMAAHFSYGSRRSKLMEIARSVNGPVIRLKLDLNTTRISAERDLFFSELRMNKSLKMYCTTGNFGWSLTNDE